MKKKLLLLSLSCMPCLLIPKQVLQKAVCTVPVADLYSEKIRPTRDETLLKAAQKIPLSDNNAKKCIRTTQLLFNEQVTIIETYRDQALIEAPFWHFSSPFSIKKNNRFWTPTSNLTLLNDLTPEQQKTIPSKANAPTFFLKKSWHCLQTGCTYSVGTQLVATKEHANTLTVTLYDPATRTNCTCTVPRLYVTKNKPRSVEKKRFLFVRLLKEWATEYKGLIPYVLGGASIVIPDTANGPYPYTGIDCSGLIRQAFSIVGVPITATNSSSIMACLEKLPATQEPQNGDIVYWKGHIAIISDVKKGLFIESRGYEHFYGIVHEIPYYEQFEGIRTTQDLVTAYRTQRPLNRIDKHGKHRQTITDFTILQFPN